MSTSARDRTGAWLRAALPAAALVLVAGGRAAAAGGTATDQAVSLVYAPTHWSGTAGASLIGVDPTDPIYSTGWWYRTASDTREYPLPLPDSEVYSNGQLIAVWNDVDGKGFRLQETTVVMDAEGPSGGILTLFTAKNIGPASAGITLFHLLDADLAGNASNDVAVAKAPRFIEQSDGPTKVSYRTLGAQALQIDNGPLLQAQLNDALVTTLDDDETPFGPGDAGAAYQFGPLQLNPNASVLYMTSVHVNMPAHVKGNIISVLGQAPLMCSGPTVDFAYTMRRTQTVSLTIGLTKPIGATVVGVDDFDGDLTSEPLSRDLATGIVYRAVQPLVAPVLPANWKLSATGDFDADGKADILWRNTTSQKLVVWTMNGATKVGNLIPTPDQAAAANWEVAGAEDWNGDGHRDLLWYNQTTGKLVMWYLDANLVRITGLFTTPDGVGSNNWKVVGVGDYGKGPGAGAVHGAQDIVWQNETSKKIVVWFMNQSAERTGGTFTTPDTFGSDITIIGPR